MKLNPKLTGGLAWAGLFVVLAVPSADLLFKQDGTAATVITSDTDQLRTASVVSEPASTETVGPTVRQVQTVEVSSAGDPVDSYIKKGKKLPSYISDAPAEMAEQKPAPTVKLVAPPTTSPATMQEPVEVAALDPATVVAAPQPYPASMRPAAPVVTTASVAPATTGQPLIVDEDAVARRDAAIAAVLEDDFPQADRVEGDMLEQWDSGSLADYLERRGLINNGSQAQASDYDEDGFFLDEGPNNDNSRRRARRLPPQEFFLF